MVLQDDVEQVGRVRRALPIQNRLYAITDKTVAAMDVSDRDAVETRATVTVGDPSQPEQCTWGDFTWGGGVAGQEEEWRWHSGCSIQGAGLPQRSRLGWLLTSVLALLLWRRRRVHCP